MSNLQVPLIVEAEANRRLDRRAQHREIEKMLDWVQNNVRDLIGIRITAPSDPDAKPDEVMIYAHRAYRDAEQIREFPERDYIFWMVETFPAALDNPIFMWTDYDPLPSLGSHLNSWPGG